ncbi:sensor histidine kinase [Nisaea sediminum]|uniref:sensor histidine kinase n=1 Tax=Nisaea sediminum TaxID=2775867 RepID=UPI0018686144|nr:PAS domain-containing sensor histidine kinase [Nisaea sediminum]
MATSGVIVWLGFWFAQKTLNAELHQHEQHYQRIVELEFRSKQEHLDGFLRILAQSGELARSLRQQDHATGARILEAAYYELENGELDLLQIVTVPGGNVIDVSPGGFGLREALGDLASIPISAKRQVFLSGQGEYSGLYAVVGRTPIIEQESRVLIGWLIGGSILNDNTLVLDALLQDIGVLAAGLVVGGEMIAAASRSEVDDAGALIRNAAPDTVHTLPFRLSDDGPETELWVVPHISPVASLRNTYLALLPGIFGLTLMLAVGLSWFLRMITKRSLSELSRYAGAVAATMEGGRDVPKFEPGLIRDFNQLGETIERVFDGFRASENRTDSVIDRAPAAIYAKDLDGRYIIANAQFLSMFGFERERVIGATDRDLFSEDLISEIQAFETANKNHGAGNAREITIPVAGADRAYLGAIFPLKGEEGQVYAHCTILADITDRKRTENALRQAKEEAEFANSAKTSFLAGVSHELRTPLNAIIGFSEMIAGEVLGRIENRNYVDYARHIQSSGTHLLSLIGDVLDLSVIESRKENVREEALDIEELGADCLRMISDQAASAGIEVSSDIDMRGRALRADARRIRQILINLLTNAVKFTPRGGHVRLLGNVSETGRIRLAVMDNGIGMDEVTQAHAFEPFMRGSTSMVRHAEGAGLGLALVKRLAELHNAEMDCKSAPGQGTTISITFPAVRSVAAPPQLVSSELGN